MIGIVKDFDNPPATLTGKTWENNCKKALSEQGTHDFKDYKKASPALSLLYHNKCAYCEQQVEASQVEHYRPKKQAKDGAHSGYYWLGYEWSNLLLICPTCNQKKSSKFPIAGTRCKQPVIDSTTELPTQPYLRLDVPGSALAEEKALLLQPEIDFIDIKRWFTFQTNGRIVAQPTLTSEEQSRTKTTIEVCDLDRTKEVMIDENGNRLESSIGYTGLLLFRRTKIQKHIEGLNIYFKDYQDSGILTKGNVETLEGLCRKFILRLYEKGTDPKIPFSCLYYTLFEEFDLFFIQPREGKVQLSTLKKCYTEVREYISTQ